MNELIMPIVLLTATGGGLGLVLALVAQFMGVAVDELTLSIREALPGVNCGACGYAGCDEYAEKLGNLNETNANLCTPGGAEVADELEALLGVDSGDVVYKTAVVNCAGTCDKTEPAFEYNGPPSCAVSSAYYGGKGSCKYGCLGFGDCVSVCLYDAIYLNNGVPVVDKSRCTGCSMCAKACPKLLIALNRSASEVNVACSSKDKGGITRKLCQAGCIACLRCVKECEFDAIKVEDNLAVIDLEKCTNCLKCVSVCPTKVIKVNHLVAVH